MKSFVSAIKHGSDSKSINEELENEKTTDIFEIAVHEDIKIFLTESSKMMEGSDIDVLKEIKNKKSENIDFSMLFKDIENLKFKIPSSHSKDFKENLEKMGLKDLSIGDISMDDIKSGFLNFIQKKKNENDMEGLKSFFKQCVSLLSKNVNGKDSVDKDDVDLKSFEHVSKKSFLIVLKSSLNSFIKEKEKEYNDPKHTFTKKLEDIINSTKNPEKLEKELDKFLQKITLPKDVIEKAQQELKDAELRKMELENYEITRKKRLGE
jgi:hypothetical protein